MASDVPTLGELRQRLPAGCRERSYGLGMGLFLLMALLSVAGFCATLLPENLWLRIGAAFVYSVFISVLFILGHDACHGSLTPSANLNRVLARLAFLPTLHPAVTWELGHNQLHHGWTNLKGVDYGYTPFSLEEFQALPAWRRGLERFFRTLPGIGFFYMLDVWWKHLIWPRPAELRKLHKGWLALDLGLVAGFLVAEAWLAAWLGWRRDGGLGVAVNLLLGVAWPFVVWNWIMAFATVQHHTHPRVAWFDSKEEWSFFFGQVEGTVHVQLPRWIEMLYHNIFEHTAHHVDPKIPLYNLRNSQQQLEVAYPASVTTIRTSPGALHRTLCACKLYDYRRHGWTDFDGRPTAERILVPKGYAVSATNAERPRPVSAGA